MIIKRQEDLDERKKRVAATDTVVLCLTIALNRLKLGAGERERERKNEHDKGGITKRGFSSYL